jgi:hypothetical protein
MKKVLLSLILVCLFSGVVFSQNFYVINVEGKVYSDGKLLKTGDKLTQEVKITFTSVNNKLYLLSPEKGNFLVVPVKNSDSQEPDWIVALKNALPESKFYKTASRGGEKNLVFNDMYDLMGFFRDKVTYIQGTEFAVNGDKIPLDQNNYFSFTSLSNPSQSQQVGYKTGQGFFILTGTETLGDKEERFELVYVQPGKKTSIGNFILDTKSRTDVKGELSLFFEHMDENVTNTAAVYYEQVLPYIAQSYGNTDPAVIREIIQNDLGIVLKLIE